MAQPSHESVLFIPAGFGKPPSHPFSRASTHFPNLPESAVSITLTIIPSLAPRSLYRRSANLFSRSSHLLHELPLPWLSSSAVPASPQPSLLERLFNESAPELARYFERRHGPGDLVQDLVQETFLQLARREPDAPPLKCPRGYLFGIARHLSHAAWSRRAGDPVLPFDAASAADIPAPAADDRVAAARETIAALEPLQREILDLRFAQDLSYAEIAEALGIPLGTVRSRLHHAVAELRLRLHSEFNPRSP